MTVFPIKAVRLQLTQKHVHSRFSENAEAIGKTGKRGLKQGIPEDSGEKKTDKVEKS